MKFSRPSERGQAIVLIAFAIVGLVAITGLAIDGGFAFSDRRHAQNAADASSLAGALAKINAVEDPDETEDPDILATLAALNIALTHGFDNDITTNTVTVNIPPVDGPYAGDGAFVQVIIQTSRDTFFAKVVGVDQTHNRVEAVARAKESINEALYGGNSIVSLKPTSTNCSGDFIFGGSADFIIDGGGIFVNSDNPSCAFVQAGGCLSSLTTTSGDPLPISIVGGYDEDDNCSDAINGDFTTGVDQLPWPDSIYILDEPSECGVAAAEPEYDSSTDTTTFSPGYYSGKFAPNNAKGDYFLEPGIYCVDEIKFTSDVMTGNNIFFYIPEGGSFDIQGDILNLTARTITDTTDPDFQYSGYLIYVAPDLDSSPENCVLNGNQESNFVGTIYAPYCNITINGSTGTVDGFHSQVIGYEVKLNGDGTLWFIYEDDENGGRIEPAELDLTQ